MKKSLQLTTTLVVGLLSAVSGWARPLGVDVSNNNGSINWTSVKNAGFTFAWAKAAEGTYFVDSYFAGNMNNGKAAGLCMGAYYFARPDEDSPSAAANYFWNVAGPYIKADGKSFEPMLDFETFNGFVGASSYSDWANQWCNDVAAEAEAAGVKVTPALYASTCAFASFNSSVAQWFSDIANPNGESAQSGSPWNGTSCTYDPWGSGAWDVWQYYFPSSAGNTVSYMDQDVYNGSSFSSMVVTVRANDDFDGDGTSDAITLNTNTMVWNIRYSHDGSSHTFQFGTNGDVPFIAKDVDHDGLADAVAFRPSNHTFYYRFSSGGSTSFVWGSAGNIPLMGGDFDGDGTPDPVCINTNSNPMVWNVRYSSTGASHTFTWGSPGDVPFVAEDIDRDGLADAVVYRPSNHTFYYLFSSNGGNTSFVWGNPGDIPLMSAISIDGNGLANAVTINRTTMVWNYRYSHDGSSHTFQWGAAGDIPYLKGDMDHDGIVDAVVYRPSNHTLYYHYSHGGSTSFVWGSAGNIPVF